MSTLEDPQENIDSSGRMMKRTFRFATYSAIATAVGVIGLCVQKVMKMDESERSEAMGSLWKMVSKEGAKTRDLAGSEGPWYENSDYNTPEGVRMLTECFPASDTHFQFKLQEPPAGLKWSYIDLNGQTHNLQYGEGVIEFYQRTETSQQLTIWLSGPEETLGTVDEIGDIGGLFSGKQHSSAKCVIEIPPIAEQSCEKGVALASQ